MTFREGLARIVVGVADPTVNLVPAKVVREQAKIAAQGPLNTKKKFFGYGRLVPQADISPEDQILSKNSDDDAQMKAWLQIMSGDPQMIWAGYFDNATGKLVADSIGEAIVVTPMAEPKKSKSMVGVAIAAAAGITGLIFASKKR